MTRLHSIGAVIFVVSAGLIGCTVNSTTNNPGNGNNGNNGNTDTCTADTTVDCMQGNGWSCTGSDTPEDNADVVCSTGTEDSGKTDYCCVTGSGVTSTCSIDSSVTCQEGTGFSCTGSDSPDQSDSSLVCSEPSSDGSNTDYCCTPYSSGGTCMQDSTVTGCTSGSYGFSCTGSDSPSSTDSSLTCSTPTTDPNGGMDYCCY